MDSTNKNRTEPRAAEAVQSGASESDILQVLSEFETGLQNLRIMYGQRQDVQSRLQDQERALNAHRAKLQEQSAQLDEQNAKLDEREAELAKIVSEQKRKREEVDKARADLEKREKDLAARTKKLEEREAEAGEASELQAVMGQLRDRVKQEVAKREKLEAQLKEAGASSEEAEQLRTQLNEALEQVAALTKAAKASKAAPRAASSDSMQLRRRRLRQVRELVREQSQKLRKGSEALKRRIEMCDQVMQQRVELAAIRDKVILAEKKAQKHRATTRAAIVTMCAAIVFGVLGGLSWALSREVAPATYVATAVIEAKGRGRDLNEAEQEEWRRFHEQLLKDPRFHETAAERFQRQGVSTLASPSEVGRMVNDAITFDSMAPGQLTLELRGQGSDRTERTLETFTAALASHANALQQRQIYGGVTAVLRPAKSGADPIDMMQTYYALGMLGAGVVACGWLAMFVWGRLSGAKTAFEMDAQIAHTLNEENWPDPTKDPTSVHVGKKTKPPGAGPGGRGRPM